MIRILVVLFSLQVCNCLAQNIILTGHVIDKTSNDMIQQASVSVVGQNSFAVTDDEGGFSLKLSMNVQKGDLVRLHISKNGYLVSDKQISATSSLPILIKLTRERVKYTGGAKTATDKTVNLNQKEKEKELFVDSTKYVKDIPKKFDIAVIVLDINNKPINSLSSDIARLYRDNLGQNVTTSLVTSSFLNSQHSDDLFGVYSQLIDTLKQLSQAKGIVIGKYISQTNPSEEGSLIKFISTASLDIVVISCTSKAQIDGFLIEASNGYDDKMHAEKGVKEKIIREYCLKHLNKYNQ